MTVLTDIPVDQLRVQASQARPGRALIMIISAVFVAIGWIAGAAVTGVVFAGVAVRYGYWRGRGLSDADIAMRAAARAPAPQPAR
jgi:hypothetical protein